MFDLLRLNLLKLFDTPTGNYAGYSDTFILFAGWSVAGVALIVGIVMAATKWRSKEADSGYSDQKEAEQEQIILITS